MPRGLLSLFLPLCFSTILHAEFEARHVHPMTVTPDGKRLLVINSAAACLSIFDISNPARSQPLLIGEVPVGLEPVSVCARTADEAWVVNELSDSVSIVNLSKRQVIDTLTTADEPADVIFANNQAFVSCSEGRQLKVYDPATRATLGSIPLTGLNPRALTKSADGSRVYVGFLLSGNRTTVLPKSVAPAQPAPTNTALPAAPQTALIVSATDSRINYTVLDHDVAEIDTTSRSVLRYLGGTGTHIFDLSIRPGSSDLWIANSEALNLTRFEPNLKGNFIRHRLSKLDLQGINPTSIYDLNPSINYSILPNAPAQAIALAQPTAVIFTPSGSSAWVAAFNSDRVAQINPTDGSVVQRVNLRIPETTDSAVMRGPRALALSPDGSQLFVLNKLSNTISTVDTATGTVLAERMIGSFEARTSAVRAGRGFLYDARLSGNGTVSCATCHLDAERDGLDWDLGDPGGSMVVVKGAALSAHQTTVKNRSLHPMKGPMSTQTLRGMAGNLGIVTTPASVVTQKFHWRGDKESIQAFNPTFANLLGGSQLSSANMDALTAYLLAIPHHPNPNRNPDRTLPTLLNGANPVTGRDLFGTHEASHCAMCHSLPSGTDNNLDLKAEFGGTQEMKNPPLRMVYRRAGTFNPTAGAVSLSGFGLGSDGSGYEMPRVHFYQLDNLSTTDAQQVAAFLLCFDTGTAPAVGRSITVNANTRNSAATITEIALLESQTKTSPVVNSNLVVQAIVQGEAVRYQYDPATSLYLPFRSSMASLTQADVLNLLSGNNTATFLGTPVGEASRFSLDMNGDGILDGDPAAPSLGFQLRNKKAALTWPTTRLDWYPEQSSDLQSWSPLATEQTTTGTETSTDGVPKMFFRLQRTW
jgi:YVTN family beta-propeller protein